MYQNQLTARWIIYNKKIKLCTLSLIMINKLDINSSSLINNRYCYSNHKYFLFTYLRGHSCSDGHLKVALQALQRRNDDAQIVNLFEHWPILNGEIAFLIVI